MKKKKKLTEDQIIKRKDRAFRKKIQTVFTNAGFEHLKTLDKHIKIGNRTVEFDSVYFYENIMLICEDTGTTNDIKSHIRNKKEAFEQVTNNKTEFLDWLKIEFLIF